MRIRTRLIIGFMMIVLLMVALALYSVILSQKSLQESVSRSKGFRNFEGLKLILVVSHDVEEVLKPIYLLRRSMVAASLILISMGITVAYFISRSITRPVEKLTKSVQGIRGERLELEIDPKLKESEGEIGKLAVSFIQMAENLKEAQEKLIRAQKLVAIGQLAGSVAHELRNPLGVIGNSAYYLNVKLADTDEKVKKHLDIIQSEVQKSNNIITDLLDFSRVTPLSLEEVDLNNLVNEVFSRIKLPENIAFETQLDENLPKIPLDPDQIQRVFQNIISNAIGAMPGGGRLEIETRAKDDFIEILFKDTGGGIPKEKLRKIFDPLFTTNAKGIGLGLAIAKVIVDRHKGMINVESEVGRGTTFIVKLPLQGEMVY